MPTPAGCLARGSVPGREEAQRERTFGCPVGAHASLAFSWARHAWHGGVEAGRSEPWPSGELRGPRGSSVAPGGAQGELSRPRQSDLRGSTVTPGELGRFALCGFLAPGGCATALSSLYNKLFLSSSRTSRSPFSRNTGFDRVEGKRKAPYAEAGIDAKAEPRAR